MKKTIGIIGGTGTLGHALVPILAQDPQVHRIRILSRNDLKQQEMQAEFPHLPLDFMVGDVRDRQRVIWFLNACTHCFHLAAMKSVDKAEYDPMEAVKTNVMGTDNVIAACILNQVEKAIFAGTDKGCAPFNIYGASKLLGERIFISGNIGGHCTKFMAVRYGNVFGSRGSVAELWRKGKKEITDPNMTRFFFSITDAAEFVLRSMREGEGGETFIPKMKAVRIGTLFKDYTKVVGLRPGEKAHEDLYSVHEARLVTDIGWAYVRWPSHDLYPIMKRGEEVPTEGFSSDKAEQMNRAELEELWGR